MKFISFSGVDGSGKSTQLELLRQKLTAQGEKVAYFHAIEFSLANKLARFFRGQKTFRPGKERAITRASWLSLQLREKFLFWDMLRFRLFLRRLRREHYDYLLSDRSFYDSLINITYLADQGIFLPFTIRLGLRCLEYALPKADVAFYFDVLPEATMTRGRAPEQGISYLRAKQALFKEKIPVWHLVSIDANRDKESVFREIQEKI